MREQSSDDEALGLFSLESCCAGKPTCSVPCSREYTFEVSYRVCQIEENVPSVTGGRAGRELAFESVSVRAARLRRLGAARGLRGTRGRDSTAYFSKTLGSFGKRARSRRGENTHTQDSCGICAKKEP